MVTRIRKRHHTLYWQSESVANRWDFQCNAPCLETSNQAAQAACFLWFNTMHPIVRQWQEIAELLLFLTIISGVLHSPTSLTATSQGAGRENGLGAVSGFTAQQLVLVICKSSPGWTAYILACYWKYPKLLPQHLPLLLMLNSTFFLLLVPNVDSDICSTFSFSVSSPTRSPPLCSSLLPLYCSTLSEMLSGAFLEHKRCSFPIIHWECWGESGGPLALWVAGSGSKANEVPELIPIITAHTINYKYKQHVSDSAGGLEDCCQRAGSMLIRITLAMGYLGNSLLSHQFPKP